ncbi:hypothetical protein E4U02_14900 [Microbacterium paludicola]|uniref:DUF3558 domain-containing protein n=1 Tax=Microbacterium paludicola TaxID=300019 RepID=A0A4Y9FLY0_9MICO|nr:hypothetical protein [Microbacterium paludicola]MBF0817692.1 hypothetical protein [Microbacterium paludicola]TFU30225.1 hypothetical protein E4U02_14900 [Microbacterium paludicola]
MRAGSRRIASGVAVLAGFAILSGCATSPPTAFGEEWVSEEAATEDYFQTAAHLELPPDQDWPDPGYTGTGPDGQPALYGADLGKVDASFVWYCAWGRELVSPESSEDTRAQAMAHVLEVTETPYYTVGLQAGDREYWREQVVDPLLQGDIEGVAKDVDTNCS